MPEHHLTSEIFKAAAVEILQYKSTRHCDINKIAQCAVSMNFLVEEGPKLNGDEAYWPFIDAALSKIYPGKGTTDIPELRGLIEEEQEILGKLVDRKYVNTPELEQVQNFAQEMWLQLRMKEGGLTPLK